MHAGEEHCDLLQYRRLRCFPPALKCIRTNNLGKKIYTIPFIPGQGRLKILPSPILKVRVHKKSLQIVNECVYGVLSFGSFKIRNWLICGTCHGVTLRHFVQEKHWMMTQSLLIL
mmetsp:Transcript_35626/g.54787  ORF Transcript_35626/g.54787 Transcript_35626/m.54787 type:complete len:115 (+) Transcript_35626:744-1088(+)